MTRLLIVILAALSMLGALSIDAYLPALPAISRQFSASLAATQQSLTAYVFAFAIMTLFYGTLSDSFGRRRVVLVSLVCYLLSSLGAAWSNSLEMLIVFRFLQGLSAGAGAVIGRAIVGDLSSGPEAQRAMSYISVVFGLAPAIAPILGGWLQVAFGWRSIFLFIAAFTFILLVVCLFALPDSLPVHLRQRFHLRVILTNYRETASHLRFMCQSLSCALMFFGIMLYVAAAPAFVIDILHLSETSFGWLFIPLIGGMTLGSLVAGWLSHRVSAKALIRAGMAIMVCSTLVNVAYSGLYQVTIPWALIPLMTYSFGVNLAMPAMTLIALERFPNVRGLASSLQTFLFMIIFTIGSGVIVPLLYGSAFNFAAASAVGAILSIVCWGVSWMAPE